MHPLLLATFAETFVNFHRISPFFFSPTGDKHHITAGALGAEMGKWRSDAAAVGIREKSR